MLLVVTRQVNVSLTGLQRATVRAKPRTYRHKEIHIAEWRGRPFWIGAESLQLQACFSCIPMDSPRKVL